MAKETSLSVKRLVKSSWASKTQSTYDSQLKKWVLFCAERGIEDPSKGTFAEGLEFLVSIFDGENAT